MKQKIEIESRKFISQDGTVKSDFSFDGLAYTNATEQYQIFGKDQTTFSHYKDRVLVPYAEKLIELGKVPTCNNFMVADNQQLTVDELIVVRKGGNNPALRGTWLHPDLAIEFGRWLSLEFGIWCNEIIKEILTYGTASLQTEDRKWVDYVEGLVDRTAGSAKQMSDIRLALLIHEKEGYNIKSFDDIIYSLRKYVPTDEQPIVFKKLRQLIKDMYEDGELSRTSHELMLEHCVDTVVKVLEKEVRRKNRIIKKFEIGGEAPSVAPEVSSVLLPVVLSIAEKSKLQKEENDEELRQNDAKLKKDHEVYDAEYVYGHKKLGLDGTIRAEKIKAYLFDRDVIPVRDAIYALQQDGFKLAWSHKLFAQSRQLNPNAPDYRCTNDTTNVQVSLWFNADGSASCKIQETIKHDNGQKDTYKKLAYIPMFSLTSIDPAFWAGTNPENTIKVTFHLGNEFLMVYGYSSDKK